jgi:hypothetical protein
MKINISTMAYVAASVLAAYASNDLAGDVGSAYHFGAVLTAAGGFTLFAVLTAAMWATIAQTTQCVAIERQHPWPNTIGRVLVFIVGMGAGVLGTWGIWHDNMSGWQAGGLLLTGVVSMFIFAVLTVLATERDTEATPPH